MTYIKYPIAESQKTIENAILIKIAEILCEEQLLTIDEQQRFIQHLPRE